MKPTRHTDRLRRLQPLLNEERMHMVLVASPAPLGYLTGLFEDGHERLLALALRPVGDPAWIVPALTGAAAADTPVTDIRAWSDGDDPYSMVHGLAREWGAAGGRIGVDRDMSAGHLLELQRALPDATFLPAGEMLGRLRIAKDGDQLTAMQRAADIVDGVIQEVAGRVVAPGVTEREIAQELTLGMLRSGGEPTFCIVASGPNSAKPHHSTSDRRLEPGDVLLIDTGCAVEHYNSDTTRVFAVGSASDAVGAVYQTVLAAHLAARQVIRPGVEAQAVDAAAREVISQAGHGERFVHRTGHGIGLLVHEPPNIVGGEARPLVEGQCFSVEPGVYLPGEFGVRIENIVAVTADGHRSFNIEPPVAIRVIVD